MSRNFDFLCHNYQSKCFFCLFLAETAFHIVQIRVIIRINFTWVFNADRTPSCRFPPQDDPLHIHMISLQSESTKKRSRLAMEGEFKPVQTVWPFHSLRELHSTMGENYNSQNAHKHPQTQMAVEDVVSRCFSRCCSRFKRVSVRRSAAFIATTAKYTVNIWMQPLDFISAVAIFKSQIYSWIKG